MQRDLETGDDLNAPNRWHWLTVRKSLFTNRQLITAPLIVGRRVQVDGVAAMLDVSGAGMGRRSQGAEMCTIFDKILCFHLSQCIIPLAVCLSGAVSCLRLRKPILLHGFIFGRVLQRTEIAQARDTQGNDKPVANERGWKVKSVSATHPTDHAQLIMHVQVSLPTYGSLLVVTAVLAPILEETGVDQGRGHAVRGGIPSLRDEGGEACQTK